MSKEQKISKINSTNGCIVQNMTAIDKQKFIFKNWHQHLVNLLEMLSLTHLSPCILKVVNIAFIDKASIQFCSIINLFFSFRFWTYFVFGVVTLVWTYFIIHCCRDCWLCRLGNVGTGILNEKKWETMLHIENDHVLTLTKAFQTSVSKFRTCELKSPNKTIQDKL